MSKLFDKLEEQKVNTNKKMCTAWIDEATYKVFKKAVKEDGLSIQKVLQTSIDVYLEERKK